MMNPQDTVYIPVPVSEKPEVTKAVIFINEDGSWPKQEIYHIEGHPINEIWEGKYTHWLKPVKLSEITTSQPLQGTASTLLDKISHDKGEQDKVDYDDLHTTLWQAGISAGKMDGAIEALNRKYNITRKQQS